MVTLYDTGGGIYVEEEYAYTHLSYPEVDLVVYYHHNNTTGILTAY